MLLILKCAHACGTYASGDKILVIREFGELQMRNFILISCLGLSFYMILDSMNAGHALVMFLLAGVIPGTNVVIEANQMLVMFTLLIGFTLSRIAIYLSRIASYPLTFDVNANQDSSHEQLAY